MSEYQEHLREAIRVFETLSELEAPSALGGHLVRGGVERRP